MTECQSISARVEQLMLNLRMGLDVSRVLRLKEMLLYGPLDLKAIRQASANDTIWMLA